jgi:predicted aspartyl protease/tetratricopeptide (TPR) repeat protein
VIIHSGLIGLVLFAASPAVAACSVDKVAELPVTMQALRPMVDVKINGTPVRMMADSGAFYSLITPGSATTLGLRLDAGPPGFYISGVNGTATISVATVKTFTLAGVDLTNAQFMVGGSETPGSGVLGQNLLGFADVEYDLPHGAIRLMESHGCEHASFAYWAGNGPYSMIDIAPRDARNPHTVGTILLNGVKVRATFDTGAATTIVSLAAAARAGIRPDSPGVRPAGMMTGIGRNAVRIWTAPFASFKFDQEEIRNVRIQIGQLDLDTEMLIGADFFIAHRVYVSNAQHRMFLTYEGGPVFNVTTHHEDANGANISAPAPHAEAPADAEGYSRQGAVALAQHDATGAIAAFTQAITKAPAEPRYLLQRATAYATNGQRKLAEADLDAALELAPGDVDALIGRAELRLRDERQADAAADLDAAARAAVPAADERFALAALFSEADQPARAIEQYDLWIKAHPDDARRPSGLNGRCWARGLAGTDLAAALSDCRSALRQRPGDLAFIDSRALVELRMGDFDKAMRDYDTVLAKEPKSAWSLYGRGILKLRQGDAAGSKADLDAAAAIDPKLAARAKGLGITP